MKSILTPIYGLILLASAGVLAVPDGVAAAPKSERIEPVGRSERLRSRTAYDVYGLTAPVDRSFEVLEGDAIAWRSIKVMLA